MADYQFNTNLTPNIQGTNIADMVNLARGVQAYQQEQQMNPLALRQKQAETTLAEETLKPKIQQEQTKSEKGQFEFESQKADKSRGILSALATSQAFRSGNRNEMIKELADTQQELMRAGFKPHEALLAVSALTGKVMQDPQGAIPFLENAVRQGVSPESRLGIQTPQLTTQAGAPTLFTSGTGTLAPAIIAGQPQQLPPQMPPPQGQLQSQIQQPPQGGGVTPTQMSLPYPVRRAGDIRPLAPSEEADRENGQKYRESLTQSTTNLSKSIRNIDEVIKDAEKIASKEWNRGAGFAGTVGRNVSTFLGTDMGIEYARLSKSLAQLQLALGADTTTDRGKDLMAAANGTITLPPDVLQEIAHRTKAEKQNIEMQSQGAQVFSQKYGDANLKKFQKDWADNSKDSRVLEAISIHNSDMSAEDKQTQINRLFENASPKYLEDVKRYRRNLEKLSKTGGL